MLKIILDYLPLLTAAIGVLTLLLLKRNSQLAERNTEFAMQNIELAKQNLELGKRNTQLAENNADLAKQNLKLAEDNRRNALREHLFKEQIHFFKTLSQQVVEIGGIFDDIQFNGTISDSEDESLEKEITKLNKLFDTNVLIIPNTKIFDKLSKISEEADKLHLLLIECNGKISEERYGPFFDSFYEAIDDIWEYYGIEELSKETLEITRGKRKEHL